MKNHLRSIILTIAFAVITGNSFAQATLVPVIENDGAIMFKVSDNGSWAAGHAYGGGANTNASIWNLKTYERIMLVSSGEQSEAFDVTDDGTIAVGSFNSQPAYWQNGTITMLPLPAGGALGEVHSVTPDGTMMAGRVFSADWVYAYACLWENGMLFQVSHATVDKHGENANFNELNEVSADGQTLLGCLNYTYLPNRTGFLMLEGEYFMFGAENYDTLTGGNMYNFYDVLSMSPNGKYVTGDIYWVEQDFSNEYYCPFRYDVENNVTELFLDDVEVASFASDNNGNLYGVTPLNFPIREALVLKNGSWVSLDQEIEESYGLNVFDLTGYDKLGNLMSVSADGNVIVGVSGLVMNNWVLKVPWGVTASKTVDKGNDMDAAVIGGRLVMSGKVVKVDLFNTSGQLQLSRNVNIPMIDVTQLNEGIYIVRMTDSTGNTFSKKVFIR